MNNSKKIKRGLLIVVSVILMLGVTTVIWAKGKEEEEHIEETKDINFVPTLIDPVEKNSCWCGTFQLVWNDMKNEVVKKNIVFTPQIKMAENLNKETFTQEMISEDHYYKVYGLKTLKLKEKIEREIKSKFNQESDILKDFDWSEDGVSKNGNRYFFYSMLYRKFEFLNPFDKLENSEFGKDGKEAKYFGIKSDTEEKVKEQIEVLFYNSEDDFAIVLKTKEDDELIFYKNPQGKTFMDIFKNMNKQADLYTGSKCFGKSDKFKAPYLQINVKRNYSELANREFKTNNPKILVAKIEKAVQSVKFTLDEKGGEVKSEAAIDMKDNCVALAVDKVRNFSVDDTFTLFIREEGKEMPYFAMNVDDISKFQ